MRLLAAFSLACLLGCSPSVIVNHARAAQVTAPIIAAAGESIRHARRTELDACLTLPSVEAGETCLDEGEARWASPIAAYNLTREAWVGWLEAMQLAVLAQTPDLEVQAILLPLAIALGRLYDGIVHALAPVGLELPPLPDLSVLGGDR